MLIDNVYCATEIQFSFIANSGQILIMMMIPMMEIQSCKSNDSQESPVSMTILQVSSPGLHVESSTSHKRQPTHCSPRMYKHLMLGTRNFPNLS